MGIEQNSRTVEIECLEICREYCKYLIIIYGYCSQLPGSLYRYCIVGHSPMCS